MNPDDEKTEDRDYDTELPENAGRAVMDDTLDKIMSLLVDEILGVSRVELTAKGRQSVRKKFQKILEDHDDEMCKVWCGEY